ncbi:MAG: SRPBCC domain-containing protein [Chloroflexota bacterium]
MENKQFKNEDGNWAVHTEIEIDASPQKVWQVLTDFEKIGEWSPALRGLRGELKDGAKVECDYFWSGKVNKLTHTLIVEDGVMFGWSDPVIPLTKDYHVYKVSPIGDGQRTLFAQTDRITGLLSPIIAKSFTAQMLETYTEFNQCLKERVEST